MNDMSIDQMLRNAIIHHQEGRVVEAQILYKDILQLDPNHTDAFGLLKVLLQNEPREPAFYSKLGDFLIAQGKLVEAITSYRSAVELEPECSGWHYNLGLALSRHGLLADSANEFMRALEIKPDYVEAMNSLGMAESQMGNNESAEIHLRNAVKINPQYSSAWYNLHSVLFNDADLSMAIDALRQAVRTDPNDGKAIFFLSLWLEHIGEIKEADALRARIGLTPDSDNPYLDCWRYIKDIKGKFTRFFASTIETLTYCQKAANLDGLVLEFGVHSGNSLRVIADQHNGTVHGFDSFAGIPDDWNNEPSGSYSTAGILPDVPSNVKLHVGWFENSLPEFLRTHKGPVRFMNVDCDVYSSTKTIFKYLGDRVVPGTVIVFDEYLLNISWREDEFKAFQEAVAHYGWCYEYLAFSVFSKQAGVRILE